MSRRAWCSRERLRVGLGALLAIALAVVVPGAMPVRAQFPDIRQMSGTPLPSAELPDGTVSVRVVRESLANNLTGVTVALVSGSSTQSAPTDAEGRAIFSGVAAGTRVQARVSVAGETVTSQTFAMPAQGGVRLILAVGVDTAGSGAPEAGGGGAAPGTDGASARPMPLPDEQTAAVPGRVVLGTQTRTIVEVIDEALEVFHVFEIANVADRPVDVGAPIEFRLPEGARTVSLLEGSSSQARVFERTLVVAGPFAPGRTMAQVAYRLAYSGPSARFDVPMPLPLIQTNLIVRLLGDTRVETPVLAQSRVAEVEGRRYWTATGSGLNAGETLTVALEGLPYHAVWPRYTALGLAGAVVLIGLLVSWSRPVDPARRIAALEARRLRLLDEFKRLEADGAASPAREDARTRILQELEGLYVLLDAEQEHAPARAGVARSA